VFETPYENKRIVEDVKRWTHILQNKMMRNLEGKFVSSDLAKETAYT
jgi:hypothetical protein